MMMIRNDFDFTILIATKDRPKELALLLDSITKSIVLPTKVVIVFSGTDINQIVIKSNFNSKNLFLFEVFYNCFLHLNLSPLNHILSCNK